MSTAAFPFPNRLLAMRELAADPAARTMDESARVRAVDDAWRFGEEAARKLYEQSGHERSFFTILRGRGVTVQQFNEDNVAGGRRYFSVYETGANVIRLYTAAIAQWAERNGLDYDTAVNLILGHECFHYLEAREIGFASKLVTLPILQIGRLCIGEKGVRALSEVGAHAFARTYFGLADPKLLQEGEEQP